MILLLLACRSASSEACDACGGACQEDEIPATSRNHTDAAITYEDRPPTGGDHNPCWATWGVHTDEVPDENWVHNLEHGGVIFLYNCPDGCPEDQLALESYVSGLPAGRALVTPYAEMTWTYAAVSWEHRLLLDCLDMASFQAFYDEHVANGPEVTTADPDTGCM